MTNRPQVLRSSTPGQAPAPGVRAPGEIWTTFPDKQLGIIDASRTAQPLIAVRYFSASANYAAGDFAIQAGALYVAKGAITAGAFNAAQWTKVAAATDAGGPYLALAGGTLVGDLILNRDPQVALGAATRQYVDGAVNAAPFLPIAGGTLTGKLILAGPPTASLDAATKAYVDAGAFVPVGGGSNTGLNDNRIINGDMRIDQRNNGAFGVAGGYTVDRWMYAGSQLSKGSWQRHVNSAPAIALTSYPYSLFFGSASAYSVPVGESYYFQQPIEAEAISDFGFGSANAQPITLSFWANSTLSGQFGGAVCNNSAGPTRSYPFAYSLPAANTWTKISITVPGDTAGTWTATGVGVGMSVRFDLGSGANLRGPANAWASANYVGANGDQSVVAVNAAELYLTGVKLEVGSVATPYNRQSLAKSMADCQRYYQIATATARFASTAIGQYMETPIVCTTQMRATPTATKLAGGGTVNNAATYPQVVSATTIGGRFSIQSAAVGDCYGIGLAYSMDAEL